MTTATPQVRAAVLATYVAFIGAGFSFASWASRIPQVQATLALSPQTLGLVLLAMAAGSVVALPLAGPVVARLGPMRTVQAMAVLEGVALVTAGVGHQFGVAPLVVGLFLFGFGQGTWDVAMNVHGADAERELGRSIMSRFHAGWSIGTVLGALLGAGMVALQVPVAWHLAGAAVVIVATIPWAVRHFLPHQGDDPHTADASDGVGAPRRRHPMAAWTEPRTLLIGLFVLCAAFVEGTGNDWIAVALISDLHASEAVGVLGFALFLAAMTVSRWVGPVLLDRYGRVVTSRVLGVISLVGVLLFVVPGSLPLAMVGALLWGFGLALGFPIGMSAGADDPRYAAGRVSVISSIGYCAFLVGPPLIGLVGEHVTVLRALVAPAVAIALGVLIAGVVRPLEYRRPQDVPPMS